MDADSASSLNWLTGAWLKLPTALVTKAVADRVVFSHIRCGVGRAPAAPCSPEQAAPA